MSNLPADRTAMERDTALLSNQAEKLLDILCPYYRVTPSSLTELFEKDPGNTLDCFTFYHIASCTIEEAEDPSILLKGKMEKYFTALHALGVAIAFGVVSRYGTAELVLGVGEYSGAKVSESILSGLLPGVELREKRSCLSTEMPAPAMCGLLSATPSTMVGESSQFFDISPIMRSLIGQDYTLFFLANPIEMDAVTQSLNNLTAVRDACFATSKRTLSLQEGTGTTKSTSESVNLGLSVILASASWNESTSISEMVSRNESISAEVQNGIALELIEYAEYGMDRLKAGRSCGMWQMAISYSTVSVAAHKIIQALLNGELSKPNPKLLPARALSLPAKNTQGRTFLFPTGMVAANRSLNPLCSVVTSSELGMVCTLPVDSVPNFELIQGKGYPLIADRPEGGIEIGYVTDGMRPLQGMPFSLSESDLNKHTFVCGITGSGKTTTVKTILKNCGKPFMVIESAKKEYRNIKLDSGKNPTIYTLGKPELNCLQINPFYIMAGVSPQTHIDYLKDLFNASFSFYGPMPYIFEKCLQNVYIKKGWNLTPGCHQKLINHRNMIDMFDYEYTSNKYATKSHMYLFPTMSDLKNEISRYIDEELQYDGDVAGNVKTAMKTRLESLCSGAKGFMFDTTEYVDMKFLLETNTIFELEGLADDSDKAFCVGLLLIFVNEYRMRQKELAANKHSGLQHLLVVEEAHRLLKNISADNSSEMMGNPKGKAVEHFTNMIAEMRAYGQGVIIAEQIPTKLAPDVIKNSSNKIIQRVVSADDQQLVANTIGISSDGAIFLGTLKSGFALCHKEGMARPVCVKVHSVENIIVQDEKIYNLSVDERFKKINNSIARLAISSKIDIEAFRMMCTLLVSSNSNTKSAVEIVKEKMIQLLYENDIKVFPASGAEKAIADLHAGAICQYLTVGVFSLAELVPDKLRENIYDFIQLPTDIKLNSVKNDLKNLYHRDLRRLGLNVIAQMLRHQYQPGIDIVESIKNFFIMCEHKDVEDCLAVFGKVTGRDL